MIELFDLDDGRESAPRDRSVGPVLDPSCRSGPWPPMDQRPIVEGLTDEEELAFWRAITEEC
jgi:hypothetical protein